MIKGFHKAKQFSVALVALLLVIFLLQNLGAVQFKFFGWSILISRALLAAVIFLLGFGLGFALGRLRRREPL